MGLFCIVFTGDVVRHALILVFALLLVAGNVFAIPPVQIFLPIDGTSLELGGGGSISYADRHDLKSAAVFLASQLEKDGSRWDVILADKEEDNTPLVLFLPLRESSVVPYTAADMRFNDSYEIEIDGNIKISAGGKAGAMYAVQRFLELVGDGKRIDPVTMIDYPDYRWRGSTIKLNKLLCGNPLELKPETESVWLKCMEGELDKLAAMRINLLGFISPIFHRLNESDLRLLERLFDSARERNIEPMPIISSKLGGIPQSVLKTDAIEGIHHRDSLFEVSGGEFVGINNAMNQLRAGDFEDEASLEKDRIFAPSWVLKTEQQEGKVTNQYLTIQMQHDSKPWRRTISIGKSGSDTLITVEPNTYYELGVRVRGERKKSSRLRVNKEEYDKNRVLLHELNRYSVKLNMSDTWERRWVPVFTSENTHYLSIRMAPENISKDAVQVDVNGLELRDMFGQLVNVLVNKETRPVVSSMDTKIAYKQGHDYEIEAVPPQEWRNTGFTDIRRARLKLLSGSKIREGEAVKVSFDSLPLEYVNIPSSKYSSVSNYTFQEYHRIFTRLNSLLPKFIHIAMSEHQGGLNRGSRSLAFEKSNYNLFINYINTLDAMLHGDGEVVLPSGDTMPGIAVAGTSLVMWDDMVNPWFNGGELLYQISTGGCPGKTSLDTGKNQEVLLSDIVYLASWWYEDEDSREIVRNTPGYYKKSGYKYFAAAWYQPGAIRNWFESLKPDEMEGLIATTWNKKEEGVALIACAAWNSAELSLCINQ